MNENNKALIEMARKDKTIMMLCYHEYLGDNGKTPPNDWKPSDKEILEVATRAGFGQTDEINNKNQVPKIVIGGNIKDKYILVDMDKEEVIKEFLAEDEDNAITNVFSLFNPPPKNYNLYVIEVDIDEEWNFVENAKMVYLPSEITEDGDYVFND